jgi:large subunit ribosomal protein L35
MKLKTKKAAAKRIRIKEGFFTRKKAYKRHLMRRKGSAQLRRLSQASQVHDSDFSLIRQMLPYTS